MIKTHYFELHVEYEIGLTAVEMVAEMIGRSIYNSGFQCFVTVIDTGDKYILETSFPKNSTFSIYNLHL